jgi:hypothetical protein
VQNTRKDEEPVLRYRKVVRKQMLGEGWKLVRELKMRPPSRIAML